MLILSLKTPMKSPIIIRLRLQEENTQRNEQSVHGENTGQEHFEVLPSHRELAAQMRHQTRR